MCNKLQKCGIYYYILMYLNSHIVQFRYTNCGIQLPVLVTGLRFSTQGNSDN